MSIIRNVHSFRLGLRSGDQRRSEQDGQPNVNSGCDVPFRTLHHIVVKARPWCSGEMRFLSEELIAEGFPGGVGVR
jgi:hypothetical protein